jgi:malate dehydrogenase (oxaloacetate-decarboxylating)
MTAVVRSRRESGRVRAETRDVVVREVDGHAELAVRLRGVDVLRHPRANKGAGFTREERAALGLDGMLPAHVSTFEEELERAYQGYGHHATPLSKHVFLRSLQDTHEVMFYGLLARHLEEMLPIVYTPTVGDVVREYHRLGMAARGLVLPGTDPEAIRRAVYAWPDEDVRMIVATDSASILGIGDRGHGGIAISIGKLALYTVAGGVRPEQTLPVLIDVGTDREELLADPLYLGARHRRLTGEAYHRAVDAFVDAVRERWPEAIVQWEDFAKDAAFEVLDRHRGVLPSFNDDIQGTGAVALAGVLAACASKGERLRDQRIVIHGAGAGGAGVAWAITEGLRREGLSAEEARRRVLVLDSKGLLIEGRRMEPYKATLAQPADAVHGWTMAGEVPDLVETVHQARATVLLGLSGQPGAFTEAVVRWLASHTAHPIVFALSNPTSASEAHPGDVLRWSDGRALVATGSPFGEVEHGGRMHTVAQGNNAFVFPGLGLAAMLSGTREVTDTMVLEAAYALAEHTERHCLEDGLVYPPVRDLREVAVRVCMRVMQQAERDGVGRVPEEARGDLEAFVRSRMYVPGYLPIVAI